MSLKVTATTRLDKQVFYLHAAHKHRICDQRPMAPGRNRLRTHHRNSAEVVAASQPLHLPLELRRLHVIRIPAKALVPPAVVHTVRSALRRPPRPSRHTPSIPCAASEANNAVCPKLRVTPRSRVPADVHQQPASILSKHVEEVLDRERRVAHRHHRHPRQKHGGPSLRTASHSLSLAAELHCRAQHLFANYLVLHRLPYRLRQGHREHILDPRRIVNRDTLDLFLG